MYVCVRVHVTGGLQAIAELLQVDNEVTGNTDHVYTVTMRRYACMALTNLTFADGANKALLCSMLPALRALVAQLDSSSEDLCQVAASVLRNLSWHSDLASKRALRDVEAATALMRSAMVECRRETMLKSVLSALWNLSSHSADNKADICCVAGALEFLVTLLSYRSPSKTVSVIENAGGILRNVSSHVAVRDDHRAVLRRAGCLQTLLRHLRSPSLTVVSNACGTLWNLSARCAEDQSTLLQLGAVAMLKNLVHSRHRMISMGSAAALKNLLTAATNLPCVAPERSLLFDTPLSRCDSTVTSPTSLPVGLHVRRQRALEDDLNRRQLSETCDDMDSPATSPTSTLRSPADIRSNSACFMPDMYNATYRRTQSPSPLRSSIVPRQSLPLRSCSHHAGIAASHSSDEISAWDRGRTRGLADRIRRPTEWSSSIDATSRDSIEEMAELHTLPAVSSVQIMSSFTGCYGRQSTLNSPSCLHSPTSSALSSNSVCSGVGSRRFLKSCAPRKPFTEPSAAMCASFLSERTENIHLDDLELKSSYDFDACGRSGSRFNSQSVCVDSDSDGQKSTDRPLDLSSDLPHTCTELRLNFADEKTGANTAAAADSAADGISVSNVNSEEVKPFVPDIESIRHPDQLMQLTDDVVTNSVSINNQHCVASAAEHSETSGTTASADSFNWQHVTNSVLLENDKVPNINISTHSDAVSDIMEESFPNLTLSSNSDLQSSTDLLMSDLIPNVSSENTAEERYKLLESTDNEPSNSVQVDEAVFGVAERDDVLCCNSAELLSLLEENTNRILRELELKTTESTSSSEVRLLEDETISLVSGHNDNELDDDDDDDDDDDYIDAISSRTYDISSASGEAACLSSRHSSSRSLSSGSDSRHSSPPVTPLKTVTPGRPRIVKPVDNVERRQDEQSAGEVKGIRGRRKALYALTRPKIPPTTQTTTRPSSAVKTRPVAVSVSAVRRPSSADTASSKPAVVRPVTNKPTSANNKTAQNASKRVVAASTTTVPCSTSRVKRDGQSAALKKPATTTQSSVVDGKVNRRADAVRARSESVASAKSSSSANQPAASSSKNERPTPPIKQATFVKADQSAEETSNSASESVTQADVETTDKMSPAVERPTVLSGNKDRYRPSSAGCVRSNKPAVSAKPAAPVRTADSATAASRFTAASKVGLRHSSPTSVRTETSNINSTVRAPPPSLAASTKSSSSSSSSAAAASASLTTRGTRSVAAVAARKPVSGQPQNVAKSSIEASKKPGHSAEPVTASSALTRTSTYDKLDDTEKLESSVGAVSSDVVQSLSEPLVLSSTDSKAVVDSCQLSEAVMRRARQLVEQTDQIQTRYVSPPQSIRFSSGMQLASDDVIQRPSERQLNAQPHSSDTQCVTPTDSSHTAAESVDEHAASRTRSDACTSQPSPSADKLKLSPIRKFGFIGLWRRQRSEQPAAASTTVDHQKGQETNVNGNEAALPQNEAASPRRKTFSWWRRTASPAGTGSKTAAAVNTTERGTSKSPGRVFGRGTTSTDLNQPRSPPTCRAAVVTPFSYRPSLPAMFADLPQSHQTKTAMLIERRMRRLKMASESSNEQASDCCKSKPEVTSRRKNLLVTTV